MEFSEDCFGVLQTRSRDFKYKEALEPWRTYYDENYSYKEIQEKHLINDFPKEDGIRDYWITENERDAILEVKCKKMLIRYDEAFIAIINPQKFIPDDSLADEFFVGYLPFDEFVFIKPIYIETIFDGEEFQYDKKNYVLSSKLDVEELDIQNFQLKSAEYKLKELRNKLENV